MKLIKLLPILALCFSGLQMKAQTTKPEEKCTDDCCKPKTTDKKSDPKIKTAVAMETVAKNKVIACKLTSPEMQKRKDEVLKLLKEKVVERQELASGYKYKFDGTDAVLDELLAFIKSERSCCDFFTFDLSISDNKSHVWLSITGPEGVKGFIKTEMDL